LVCGSLQKVRGPKTQQKAVTSNDVPGQIVFKLSNQSSDLKPDDLIIAPLSESVNANISIQAASGVILDKKSRLSLPDDTSHENFNSVSQTASRNNTVDDVPLESADVILGSPAMVETWGPGSRDDRIPIDLDWRGFFVVPFRIIVMLTD